MAKASEILNQTAHRPWLMPGQTWVMTQTWQKLLFAHWPIPSELLAPFIPAGLQLDTYEGSAWISIVPFKMGFRLRYSPYSVTFGELNVRTYVIKDGKPGVFFFSLDASDLFTVLTARHTYALPYHLARIQLKVSGQSVSFSSQRSKALPNQHGFKANYEPTSDIYYASENTLEYWLTERYCLYSVTPDGSIYRGEVHHLPWALQQAQAQIEENTILAPTGLALPKQAAILHYVEHLDIVIWPPHKLKAH